MILIPMQPRVCLYLLLISSLFCGRAGAAAPVFDFRVVIDASARMQELDPASRLEAALRLMNGLIPQGSQAGIWTYGRYVEMVAKWGRVDDAWRERADLATTKIRTSSKLTNLEQALARARVGWQTPDPARRRVLLLVTAGGVEVSRDQAENLASRQRLLQQGLADLVAAGVEIHSIALGAEADHTLLQRLAVDTGGIYTRVDDARELPSAFYRVYARMQNPDTIAIAGNEFKIDKHVRRLTLMLFNANGEQAALLVPPDSPAISAAKPRKASWRSGDGFDLIRLDRPEAGVWRIDADMDPGNRLLVESQMELRVSGIPVRLTPADGFEVAAELYHQGKKIRRNSYLRFVDFRLIHIDGDGLRSEHLLQHTSERVHKGRYLYNVEPGLAEGRHRFVVVAKTSTFSRRQEFETDIRWPAVVSIRAGAQPGQYRLRVAAREQFLDPAGLVAEVEIAAPGGKPEPLRLEPAADGSLQADFETLADGLHNARVRLSAQSHRGEIVDLDLGATPFVGVRPEVKADPVAAEEAAASAPLSQRKLIGFIVVGVNLSLLLALLLGWLILRRRKAAAAAESQADDALAEIVEATTGSPVTDESQQPVKAAAKPGEPKPEATKPEATPAEAAGEIASGDAAGPGQADWSHGADADETAPNAEAKPEARLGT